MNRSSLPLSLSKLKKMWDDPTKTLRCDLPFQRLSGVWNPITKSNLVWSLLADSYIPPIVLLKDKDGVDDRGKDIHVYNIEDGQQRLTNLFSFMNDEWACHSATTPVVVDGFTYDLAGLKFSEMPEELQNSISQYRLSVQCLENCTMEEAETLFFNINSGVQLSAVQKSKSKMGTGLIRFFAGLLEGGFFTQAINITEKQARAEDDLLMLLQVAMLLDNRHEALAYKNITAATCLSYAASIRGKYNSDKQSMLTEVIQYLDRAFVGKNKFLRKNNAPIVIVMAKVALEQGVEPKAFAGFVNAFANSINPDYEGASGSGNVKAKLVQMRLRVMFHAFCGHFELGLDSVKKPFSDDIPLVIGVGSGDEAEDGESADPVETDAEADMDVEASDGGEDESGADQDSEENDAEPSLDQADASDEVFSEENADAPEDPDEEAPDGE